MIAYMIMMIVLKSAFCIRSKSFSTGEDSFGLRIKNAITVHPMRNREAANCMITARMSGKKAEKK